MMMLAPIELLEKTDVLEKETPRPCQAAAMDVRIDVLRCFESEDGAIERKRLDGGASSR